MLPSLKGAPRLAARQSQDNGEDKLSQTLTVIPLRWGNC